MKIGVDFDNTIVCFDDLFYKAALEKKLIPADTPTSKEKVRDYLRSIDQEPAWTELQGYVYGVMIRQAPAFPGALDFFKACRDKSISISIVSHKTRTPFLGEPHDLHKAALDWLRARGFFGEAGLPESQVYLELTKRAKLERIGALGCTHFIDDLPEFLEEAAFPKAAERILFDPNKHHAGHKTLRALSSWAEIRQWILKN